MPRGEDSDATAVQESIVGSGNVTMKPFAGWDSNPSVPVPTAPVGGPGSQQAAAMAVHDAVQQASLMTQPIPMHHSMIMGTTILKPLCWVCGKDVSVPSKPQGRPLCDLYESVRAKIPAPVEPGSKRLCSKHYNMISSSMSAIDSVLWAADEATLSTYSTSDVALSVQRRLSKRKTPALPMTIDNPPGGPMAMDYALASELAIPAAKRSRPNEACA